MTSAWVAFTQRHAPLCKSLTYVDDQILWMKTGIDHEALAPNANFDKAVG